MTLYYSKDGEELVELPHYSGKKVYRRFTIEIIDFNGVPVACRATIQASKSEKVITTESGKHKIIRNEHE